MGKDRAVLYLRLSKEDADKLNEGDDSASIRSQRLLLLDYARARGYEVVGSYSDDDESGLYDDRPGFGAMMRDARAGAFDVIIAKTQSRFSRNLEHIEKYLHHDLPDLGVRFIGVVDGADTENEGNKKSRQIHGLVNEWYCEDLSKNVRSAFRAKMRSGQFLGSSCPYGYKKDAADHNHLVPDAYAAGVVQKIYALYLSGHGKAKIASLLSAEGILVPTAYKREVLGENYQNPNAAVDPSAWSYQTVHAILNNQAYAGHLVQNKANTRSYKDRRKRALPKEEWIVVRGTHEPIVSQETFDLAQKLQKARARSVGPLPASGLFSGILYCADCGRAMVKKYAGRAGGGFTGYVCRTYKTKGKRFCASHGIGRQELEEAVLQSLKREAGRILTEADREELMQARDAAGGADFFEREIRNIRKRLRKLEGFQKKTYESLLEGLITKEEYRNYRREQEKEAEALKRHEEALRNEKRRRAGQEGGTDDWAEGFQKGVCVDRLTREAVVGLIDRIEVEEGGVANIYYKFRDGA